MGAVPGGRVSGGGTGAGVLPPPPPPNALAKSANPPELPLEGDGRVSGVRMGFEQEVSFFYMSLHQQFSFIVL